MKTQRKGNAIIEVLILVVILAIIAAIVRPGFQDLSRIAKKHQLHLAKRDLLITLLEQEGIGENSDLMHRATDTNARFWGIEEDDTLGTVIYFDIPSGEWQDIEKVATNINLGAPPKNYTVTSDWLLFRVELKHFKFNEDLPIFKAFQQAEKTIDEPFTTETAADIVEATEQTPK